MQKRVLVIGMGLIGGSIALAIKKIHDVKVIGFDIRDLQPAIELGVIDEIAGDVGQAAEDAHLIVLALPVEETASMLAQLAHAKMRQDVIITDVGSTKEHIMIAADTLLPREVTFIGGHPMAGSHKNGVESAKAHLFENAFYILTPRQGTATEKVEELKLWLAGTHAHFLLMQQKEHDYVTGIVSHFPHLIAAGLVKQVKRHAAHTPLVNMLAAGGFRDITRIASSSPKMWNDIVKQNQGHLSQLLEEWIEDMQDLKQLVDNGEELQSYFSDAKMYRDALPLRTKGAIPSYFDLYVDVLDKAGELAKVTAVLAENGISITNLQILEAREGLLGVLRISFRTEKDRMQASGCLESVGYETYEAL
ncbi:prephenate dehydrogenase [Ectobacillus sp. JY-23]|nr:prephenate dehydrogenase [Ectobacillus sp. JY-23]UOY94569.1 prephenate dehydrogenase [Ectobacillus sp. JY-23]